MTNKPGVVLIHGAWHTPWHFENVKIELEREGYAVEAPAMPTEGMKAIEDPMPKAIAVVKQAIHKLASQNKNVVVVMHSFGGVGGSEAVAEFEEEMQSMGSQHGRVVHLLYVSAIIIDKGTDWMATCKEFHKLEVIDGMARHLEPIDRFYSAMDPALAQQCAEKLQLHSLEASMWTAKHRGWADHSIPVTYIACKKDMTFKIDVAQREFIERIEGAGVKDFKVERIDCDHTPWMNDNRNEFFGILFDVLGRASSEGS